MKFVFSYKGKRIYLSEQEFEILVKKNKNKLITDLF